MPTRHKNIDPLIGRTLNRRYRIQEFIFEGGMGLLYRGVRLLDDSPVAVKLLHSRYQYGTDEQRDLAIRLLQEEARVLQELDHPNIVSLVDKGEYLQLPYLVMEWVQGITLDQMLTSLGPMKPFAAFNILKQVCSALEHAHSRKILHLDISARNIMVDTRIEHFPIVTVIDFGLGRLLQSSLASTLSRIAGTPAYMAPEVYESRRVGPMSDIYSLGVVTFELLTGRRPFSATQMVAAQHNRLNDDIPRLTRARPDLPPKLDAVIVDALKRSPIDRIQSANEFLGRYKRAICAGHFVIDPVNSAAAEESLPQPILLKEFGTVGSVLISLIVLVALFAPGIIGFEPKWMGVLMAVTAAPMSLFWLGASIRRGVDSRASRLLLLPALIFCTPIIIIYFVYLMSQFLFADTDIEQKIVRWLPKSARARPGRQDSKDA